MCLLFAEGRRLPPGSPDRNDPHHHLLHLRPALVRRRHRALHQPRPLAHPRVRDGGAGREAAVPGHPRAARHPRPDLPHDRPLGADGPLPRPHPHARSLRGLPLHGRRVPQGHPVLRAHTALLHAQEVPAGLPLPAQGAALQGAPLHRHPDGLSRRAVGHQGHQADVDPVPTHGIGR